MEGGAGAGSWQLPARPLLMDAFRVGQGPDQLHALPGRPSLLWDGGRASVEWASSSASPASRPSVHSCVGVPPHSAVWALGARRGEDTLRVRRRAHIDHYRRTCHMCAQGLGAGIGRPWAGLCEPMMSALDRGSLTSAPAPLAICGVSGNCGRVGGRYAVRARPVRKVRGNAGPPSLCPVSRLPFEGGRFETRICSRGAFEGCCTRRRCARAKAALA